MALYAEFNDDGSFARERDFTPPLGAKEIKLLLNGKPRFLPLIVAPAPIDPDTEKLTGFTYKIVGGQAVKTAAVVALDAGERKTIEVNKALIKRAAALPPREREIELVYETLIALVDFAALSETALVKLDLTAAQLNELKARLAALRDNPIP